MPPSRHVLVIGGTGFLGYHAVCELSARGWGVTVLGLQNTNIESIYPANIKVIHQDLDEIQDADLLAVLGQHMALVYAAGVDDRVTPKKPAYPFFHYANVETCMRVLNLAKQAGIKRAIVLGSYFSHFSKIWPEMKLTERHPYIRSRVEQEIVVTSIPGMDVLVLELPYVFGGIPVPGWKSLWMPLIKYIRSIPVVFYMKGGSACISAKSVGQAIVGALEHGESGKCYPVCDENLTWTDMLVRLAAANGLRIRVVSLPTWLIKIGLFGVWFFHQLSGREAGLDPLHFAPLQTSETFIDPLPSQKILGYETGRLNLAFMETVEYSR
jgi:dihydroflavonol-4-reductase